MRRGFTLIETLVALLLLEIGMLGLAATSAVVARDLAVAHRTTRAQMLARNRLESLEANACEANAGASVAPGGYDVSWIVQAAGKRRTLSVRVAFRVPGGKLRVVTLQSAALCPA
jgi:type IV pilus modification protein PilV